MKKNKWIWFAVAAGVGLYLLNRRKKASGSMYPQTPPRYIYPVGTPGGPGARPPISQNTQNLLNTMQTWINQHPG